MPRSDVVICGAGPAGVTMAALHRGEKVVVLDHNPFYKPCGELVLRHEAEAMGADVTRRASHVRVTTPYGSREFKAETSMIDKAAWMEKTLDRSGAQLVKARVKGPLISRGSCVGVEAEVGHFAALNYDCTGAARTLASRFRPASEREFATCYEETVKSDDGFEEPLAYYDERVAGGGYAWVFPRGDGTMYVGLATWPWASDLREGLSQFKKKMKLDRHEALSRKGSRIFLGFSRQPGVEGLRVSGEANGSCDPYTGSGIFQAVTDARKEYLGVRRSSGALRKTSAFALRSIPAAYLQALELVPVPFVQYYP